MSLTWKDDVISARATISRAYSDSKISTTVDDEVLFIKVVSNYFLGTIFSRRFHELAMLFEEENSYIARKYTLVFEAWTKEEWENLSQGGDQ